MDRGHEVVPRIRRDEVHHLLLGARLEIDLQAQLHRQPARLGGEDRLDVHVERHVQLAGHDLVHLPDEVRVRVVLPPLPEDGHRLDAPVEVLTNATSCEPRDLDVAIDVVAETQAGRGHVRCGWIQVVVALECGLSTTVPCVNRRPRTVEQLAIRPTPERWPLWATIGHLACQRVSGLCGLLGEPEHSSTPFPNALTAVRATSTWSDHGRQSCARGFDDEMVEDVERSSLDQSGVATANWRETLTSRDAQSSFVLSLSQRIPALCFWM